MKMRKILSLLVSAALLTPAVPAMADGTSAATTAVRVEFEDQTISGNGVIVDKEITGISGKVVKFDTGYNDTQYFDTKVTVPEDGFYNLKMVATSAKTSDGWMSPVLISVNGGIIGWINGKDEGEYHVTEENVSYDQSTLYGGGVWTLYKQTFDRTIPLKKGENTIKFQINKREADTGVYGFFDYYEVEKVGNFPTLNESGATIQFEDFEYRADEIRQSGDNKYVRCAYSPIGSIVNTYVNVTKAGRYNLGIAACNDYSTSTAEASPISVVTDHYEVRPYATTADIDSTFTTYGSYAGNVKMQNIKGSGIYLKEGVNKISAKILGARTNGETHTALDCIKLTYAGEGETMTAQGGKIEFENWVTPHSRKGTNDNADGGAYLGAAEVKTMEDVVVYIDAQEDAVYSLSIKGLAQLSGYTGAEVFVNGDSTGGLLDKPTVATGTKLTGDSVVTTDWNSSNSYNYDLINKVLLKKGLNEVRIKLTPRSSDSTYFTYFDSMTFTPVSGLVTITKDVDTVECEDWGREASIKTAGGGQKYVQFGNGTDQSNRLDMYVNVENAGNYVVNAVTGHRYSFYDGAANNATHISPLNITVGGKKTQLNASNAKIGTTGYSGGFGEVIADNILKHSVKLEKGINKITFTAEQRAIDDKGYYCELDCVKLSFADYMPAAGGTFEAENGVSGTTYTVIDADSASGKKFVKFDGDGGDEVIEVAINAEKAGKYQIKVSAAVNNGEDATAALSHGEVYFNNNAYGLLKASDYYYLEEGNDYPFADYYVNNVFDLVEGENKIEIYPYTQDETSMKSAFDSITVTPIVDLGTITAENAEVSLAPGSTSQIVLKAGDKTVTADDVYMITYASSAADVASVSADGVITANNGGTADITVSVKENAVTAAKNVTVKVTVTDSRQIYFSGVTADNGVSYKININTAFENALSVFTAAYALDGSLSAVAVDSIEAGSAAGKTVTTTITKPNGGHIKLLVWDGMKPILKDIIK